MAAKKGKRKPKFRVGQVVSVWASDGSGRRIYVKVDGLSGQFVLLPDGQYHQDCVRPLTAREKGRP